ncbi:MAG: carbamoyltransferase HypF [Gemmataceae bacterium]
MEHVVNRMRFTLTGVVQGVGLRPAIHRTARRLGLTGVVRNHGAGVVIEVQGEARSIRAFEKDFVAGLQTPARIDLVESEYLELRDELDFRIDSSEDSPQSGFVATDTATCPECWNDVVEPGGRRFGHAFATCSVCGPRYSILRHPPFDRSNTSMNAFPMCAACLSEYRDDSDRRHHAQTISCPACGPRLVLECESTSDGADAIEDVRSLLRGGRIVAIKGIGGFHLACDATNHDAVALLRTRKERSDKPFAMMAASVAVVQRYAVVEPFEEELLGSRECPIVVLRRRLHCDLAPGVAPGTSEVGFMLPSTPLHRLLAGDGPLVLTSANVSNEPILWKEEEARRNLAGIADAIVFHDREIVAPCEDSVVRCVAGRPQPIRRSRGFVPLPIRIPPARPILAVGGDLKGTICLAASGHAFLGPHMGDMEHPSALELLEQTVERYRTLFRLEPEAVACDLHPGYHTARWAEEYAGRHGLPLVRVPHHRAHVAALLADCCRAERIIGVCFDGTGLGEDGTIWGGEFFLGPSSDLVRVAHLWPVPMPGGGLAIEKPYRMALSWLHAAGVEWSEDLPCVQGCPPAERTILKLQIERGLNCFATSSVGRLFDAVSALVGVCTRATYEGQAAIELEACCDLADRTAYEFAIQSGSTLMIDARPVIREIVVDLRRSVAHSAIAARFHRGLSRAVVEVCRLLRERSGLAAVGLTGGAFQNATLTTLLLEQLSAGGFEVFIHRQVPPNDGGLSLGQALLAGAVRDA